jgi:thioredoxin reductase (NADPH)
MSARNVVIIGSGPAGYTAAIYAARAMLEPMMIAGEGEAGGQLMLTTDVENFPGFPEGVQGQDLMASLKAQAVRFGTEVVNRLVTEVDFSQRPFKITHSGGETVEADSVIITTGASARWLGLPEENELRAFGITTCATCDGAFYRDLPVVVVGGGDSACEEAHFLTRYCSSVSLIHRRDELRASKVMQERVLNHEKIDVQWNSVITRYVSDEPHKITGVMLKDTQTGEERLFETRGVFIAIGHDPNTGIFQGKIDLDDEGYILPKKFTMTSVPGVFAAGDVVDTRYRQAITAAGMGCQAAIDCERWLEENKH